MVCVRTFKHQLQNDTWSYYTLHFLMDVCDIQSLAENNKHYMNESVLDYMMLNVYRLFLNITVTRPPNVKDVGYLRWPLRSCLVW